MVARAGDRVTRTAPSGRSSILRTFLVVFAALATLSSLWALAGPVYSVPDENAHLTKAVAQWQGDYVGYQRPGVRHPVLDLPDGYRFPGQAMCFVTRSEVPADCGVEVGDASGTPWAATWVSTYNPTYYALTGWPSILLEGTPGVLAMRIVSGMLSSALLALAVAIGSAGHRARWVPLAAAFLASPMVLYFAGAVNPQGLEIAAAMAFWVCLHRILTSYGDGAAALESRRLIWGVGAISAVLLANVRSLGPLWVVVIVVASLAMAGLPATRRLLADRVAWIAMAAVALGGAASAIWTLTRGTLSGQALPDDAPLVGGSFVQGAAFMLRHLPTWVQQAVGYFGWFDAPIHGLATALYLAALAVVVVLAVTIPSRRRIFTILGLLALCIAVPALVQGASVSSTGIIWQGRYGLFLYLAVPLFASFYLSEARSARGWFLAPRVTAIVSGMLAVFSVVCFVLTLRRYVSGTGVPITDMIRSPEWQPPGTWPVLVAAYIAVALALAVWLTWQSSTIARSEDLHPAPDPVGDPRAGTATTPS